jgi:hypothetical protein
VRRSPTEHTALLRKPLSAICACLWLAGCDAVHYDFGVDAGPVDPGASCDELVPEEIECPDAGTTGCAGEGESAGAEIGESIGCTPAGLALGVVALDGPTDGVFDLYAWAAPVPWIDSAFNDGVSLAVFPDACGAETFGGGGLECDYRPWLLKTGLTASELFLHVQSVAGAAPDALTEIGFQMVPADGWDGALPAATQPVECDVVPYGPLDDRLLYPDPLTGAPRALSMGSKPPAALVGVSGAPWICGDPAAGWRQAGYLLRNQGDAPVRVRGVHLTTASGAGPSVDFHFGLFNCLDNGTVAPEQLALASSCYDHGDHPTKETDVEFAVWDVTSATEYLLILQVPPGAGSDFYIRFDVE